MARKSGFIVVFNRIPALIAAVEANSRTAPMRAAEKIAASAKAYAPVDTGYLRSSIRAVSVSAGKEADVVVSAPYAAFVEYGTRYMPAQPFLYPAVMDHKGTFELEMMKPLYG